jgi:hypothetical protein
VVKQYLIYKSKHGVRPSVCVDKNWAVPGRFFQSLPVPCGAGDKQGRAGQGGQGSRCGGPREVPFLLKKSLGKTGGPASNPEL